MKRDKANPSTPSLPPLSLFRGLFQRVARRLRVDPSYVSRVARGERNSESVRQALEHEMMTIREHLNNHNGNHNHHQSRLAPNGKPASRRLVSSKKPS